MIVVKQHANVKGIYFVNGKTAIVDQNAYISNTPLTSGEDKTFRHYLKTSKRRQ